MASISGSNPSILRDDTYNVWHMVYTRWGGGLAYSNSTDLSRWQKPILFYDGDSSVANLNYLTLVGSVSNVLTTNGAATLYFGGKGTNVTYGRGLWYITVNF